MYSLKRVGSTCILLTNDITAPTFRVDGPYGSPNQVNAFMIFRGFFNLFIGKRWCVDAERSCISKI